MFNFLLNTGAEAVNEALSLGEKLTLGGQVTLLGMGTVFAVLALLWGLVELLHMLLAPISGAKKQPKTAAAPAPTTKAPAPAVPAAPVQTPAPAVTDDLALIAVITAAVAASNGRDPSSFRVVSFKRANNKFSSVK